VLLIKSLLEMHRRLPRTAARVARVGSAADGHRTIRPGRELSPRPGPRSAAGSRAARYPTVSAPFSIGTPTRLPYSVQEPS
jgi:hypothetical protein